MKERDDINTAYYQIKCIYLGEERMMN